MANEVRSSEKAFWSIISAVFFGNFLAVMNTSTVNIAVPAIMGEFSTHLPTAQWTVTGFMLAAGAAAPSAGWFGARFGYKRVYIAALSGFFLFSVICILSSSIEMLIIARMMQGVFSGIMMPATMTLIYQTIDKSRQAYGISLWSLSSALAPAVGPVLAGFLIDIFDWRALFYFNLPVSAGAIIAAVKFLPDTDKGEKTPFDFWGLGFSFGGSILLLTAFAKAGTWGWTDVKTLSLIGAGAFLLLLFVKRELKIEFPLLNFSVFQHRRFAYGIILNAILSIALYAGAFLVPIFLQTSLNLGALHTGLIMMPGAFVMAFFTPITGKLYNKIGPLPLIMAGLIVMAIGTFMMGELTIETTALYVIVWTSIRYLGIALCNMPIINVGMSAVPLQVAGYASALNNWTRQCIASLSIALFSGLIAYRSNIRLEAGGDLSAASAAAAGDVFLISLIPLIIAVPLTLLLREKHQSSENKILAGEKVKNQ
ncbi:DHA2 family efflux MFS transporter permease subunit [Bacillus norwichensis]|uniref:DHA2 family efflux MFS transporter permease subunit n=1 Tax=Bacillus norwichensis TaxID=2762217 RepID=A0ABR8VQP1_9BACI|nr:DHA2 family efflux MFS transporter permease subunit [Bacillus norwichensis]MBD8007094.1 DHA2 family efflux MFS transporter permease subunit [Bacillus norwichensis]